MKILWRPDVPGSSSKNRCIPRDTFLGDRRTARSRPSSRSDVGNSRKNSGTLSLTSLVARERLGSAPGSVCPLADREVCHPEEHRSPTFPRNDLGTNGLFYKSVLLHPRIPARAGDKSISGATAERTLVTDRRNSRSTCAQVEHTARTERSPVASSA